MHLVIWGSLLGLYSQTSICTYDRCSIPRSLWVWITYVVGMVVYTDSSRCYFYSFVSDSCLLSLCRVFVCTGKRGITYRVLHEYKPLNVFDWGFWVLPLRLLYKTLWVNIKIAFFHLSVHYAALTVTVDSATQNYFTCLERKKFTKPCLFWMVPILISAFKIGSLYQTLCRFDFLGMVITTPAF
jgi:hypothetical protein